MPRFKVLQSPAGPLVGSLLRVALGLAAGLVAAVSVASAEDRETPTFDRIWGYADLYDNEENRFLQRFALSGRIQPESVWFDSEQGEFSDEFLWRRFRFGFKASLLQDWVLHVEGDFDLNGDFGDMYERLTDAYVGWSPKKRHELKFLKQSVPFTLDGATSSKSLLTLQRNVLTNNLWFPLEYFTGIGAKGKVKERWLYHVGVFSTEDDDEISGFDASLFSLLSIGHQFEPGEQLDAGLIRIDYVYNQEDPLSGTRDFSRVLCLVTKWQLKKWGLWTDVSSGDGFAEQSDVWGIALMPFYDFTWRYQAVLRLTFVTSDGPNGVRLPRYADRIVEGTGDEFSEIYVGFNAFFYGHKFKLQTGVEYGVMEDEANDVGQYKGWGFSTGLRFSW